MTGTDAIRTENLTRVFGDITAVKDLTLRVPQGSVFGLLGPNGAGKTTTVRMLTALIAPSEGKAWVDGLRVGKQDQDIRRRVGVLTETPGLYEQLTAARNLEIFARLYEVPDPTAAVEKYLRMLGLWERRDDLAGEYSKGMRQKLAIARALMHEPPILFLDEPTAGLDPASARLLRDFIRDLKTQGRTIVLCTHNLEEADELCDEIGLFSSHLIAHGTPKELRQRLFGRHVVFHLSQEAHSMQALVENMEGVMEVKAMDNKLVVRVSDPEQVNPAIVNALVAAGAGIQFVGEMRHSLEDVYLQLIEEGGHGEN